MATFVVVVETGSFRAAARALALSPAAVSERVARLETALDKRLLNRSTRSIAPTEAGQRLFEACREPSRAISDAMTDIGRDGDVSGLLRISAPPNTASLFLNDLVSGHLRAHPAARVEIVYEDRKIDPVAEGYDLVVRSGRLLDADSYARPVGPQLRPVVVAAPPYLERAGTPRSPADLAFHDAILWQPAGAPAPIAWAFREGVVQPRPARIASDVGTVIHLAREGHGLAFVYEAAVLELVRDRAFVALFRERTQDLPRYSLAYVGKRHLPTRVRLFLETAKHHSPMS